MLKTLVLIGLAAFATARGPPFGRRFGDFSNNAPCEEQLAELNGCLADKLPSDAERDAMKAAKDQCFEAAGCEAPERKRCAKEAMEQTGLDEELEGCAAEAGVENLMGLAKAFGKGKMGGRGGRRGGRRGRRGGRRGGRGGRGQGQGMGGRKAAKLLEQCDGDQSAAESVQSCLQQLKEQKQQQMGSQNGPKACFSSVNPRCLYQAKQSVCECAKPAFEEAKDEFFAAVRECREEDEDDADEDDAEEDQMEEKAMKMIGKICGGGRRGGKGRGGRGRGGRGGFRG